MASVQGKFVNITTNATTVLNALPGSGGVLQRIIINTGGTTSTATIYNNTQASGEVIGTLSTLAVGSIEYNCQYGNGLTVVTAGGAAANITVVYS